MEIMEFTTNVAFNYFFSVYVYLTALVLPVFAGIALFRN